MAMSLGCRLRTCSQARWLNTMLQVTLVLPALYVIICALKKGAPGGSNLRQSVWWAQPSLANTSSTFLKCVTAMCPGPTPFSARLLLQGIVHFSRGGTAITSAGVVPHCIPERLQSNTF